MSDAGDLDPEELEALLQEEIDQYDRHNRESAAALTSAGVINWRERPDEEARAAWVELRSWVEWFTARYQISGTVVPNCWWRHGVLVEELSALHTAHTALFASTDSGLGPIGWHERLPAAKQRLKEASAPLGCTTGQHQDKKPRDWSTVTDEDDWVTWSAQAHGQ